MNQIRMWILVAVIALVTAVLRFLPFVLFREGRKPPRLLEKLGRGLPAAVMGMLVVYCLKGVEFSSMGGFLPAAIACAMVVLLHLWRRNTLLSILGGTLCYMFFVQSVF